MGVIFWSIWLNTNFFLYAGDVQGDLLNKNMARVPKGRKSKVSPNGMPANGNHDDGYFCQTWMDV
jgi:hypothetical protein